MTRSTMPAFAGPLLLLAGCSQNRYDPYPYPNETAATPRTIGATGTTGPTPRRAGHYR